MHPFLKGMEEDISCFHPQDREVVFFRGGRDPCGPDDEGGRTNDSGTEHLLLCVTSTRHPTLFRSFNVRPRIAAGADEVDGAVVCSATMVPPVSHAIFNQVTQLGGVTNSEDINPLLVCCSTFKASQR